MILFVYCCVFFEEIRWNHKIKQQIHHIAMADAILGCALCFLYHILIKIIQFIDCKVFEMVLVTKVQLRSYSACGSIRPHNKQVLSRYLLGTC